MHGLAEIEGNALRVNEAKNLLERDITPLAKEVKRALEQMGREELFYTNDNQHRNQDYEYSDMESLIRSSDDLLRDSRAVLADTEHVGTTTLHQMGRQREQLLNAQDSLESVRHAATQARTILTSMSRRACRSRLALYGMIFTLIMANLFVLYCIYKKHHKPKSE
jgi:vesicle transport through interaction with t-SNAREs protein 1